MASKTGTHVFDLTPDPKVLVALTHTPLQPLDALCELVDNALDSFSTAKLEGRPVDFPLVQIDLPGQAEVGRGEGVVRIRDNGPGLTADAAEKAMRAGFSGNNPFDTLGLFGMGFNIATGKLGRQTRLLTARAEDDAALEVLVDLIAMQEAGSYLVPVREIDKPAGLDHGTVLEVSGWWPAGNPNNGFIRRLATYSKPTVRDELGRRYATILREENVRMLVNREPSTAFEHCVWDRSRYVERRSHGQIPAVLDFNEVIGTQTRCFDCNALVRPPETECPNCGSKSFRSLEERIRGWVGIQRFDDQTQYGIDLIRNGRSIRISEQAAFFTYVDDLKRSIKDYPIDSQYGRIVGEVHLNHVPVDFLKQDFQRSSPEWQAAMAYLRGDSSLQPGQAGADGNSSPVFRLYQGYRKVRNPGRGDMYMGYWDTAADKPKRISRGVEEEYYAKFKARAPGFHDDAEWWKLVERADQRPLEPLVECPECGAENLESAEECQGCGRLLKGKTCINKECEALIPLSASSCPECGESQVIELQTPWRCGVCGTENAAASETCDECSSPRGAPVPTSRDHLLEISDKDDDLSLPALSVRLADDTLSQPIDVDVFVTRRPILPLWNAPGVPTVAFKGHSIEIFVDPSHAVFKRYRTEPHELVAAEVAQFLFDANRRLLAQASTGVHTLSNLMWQIIRERWPEELQHSPEKVRDEIATVFDVTRAALVSTVGDRSQELYDELTEPQRRALVNNLLTAGEDVGRLSDLAAAGGFIRFIDEDTLVEFLRIAPELFFDGTVWSDSYVADLEPILLEQVQEQILAGYLNAMEDCAAFVKMRRPDDLVTHRAEISVELLVRKLVA